MRKRKIIKELREKLNEFENALILIAEGDLLKREMQELAKKTLEVKE